MLIATNLIGSHMEEIIIIKYFVCILLEKYIALYFIIKLYMIKYSILSITITLNSFNK